jgi:hypothetical protein
VWGRFLAPPHFYIRGDDEKKAHELHELTRIIYIFFGFGAGQIFLDKFFSARLDNTLTYSGDSLTFFDTLQNIGQRAPSAD